MTIKINGTDGLIQAYDYQALLSGFSYTFVAGVQVLLIDPTGTLATGTIKMPPTPSDGMTISFSSTKAILALTVNPNTGQSINNAITALSAGQSVSYIYRSASLSWFPFAQGGSGGGGGTGPAGPAGPSGPSGAQGVAGTNGNAGPAGPSGPQGPSGPAGNNGSAGTAGPQGPSGPQGNTGPSGPSGASGNIGTTGPAGPAGPQGPIGPSGPSGPAGSSGNIGTTGPSGPTGAQGSQGVPGPAGPSGPAGSGGPSGPSGPAGTNGNVGTAGPAGPAGPGGAAGPAGPSGPQGNQGAQGAQGTQGPQGPQGPQGAQGNQGLQGNQGNQGPQGPQGNQGVSGPQGPGANQSLNTTNAVTFAGVTVNGAITATGDITAFYSPSDKRLKENIIKITGALDKVSQINGYHYNYINKKDDKLVGVIAQELETVLPEAVFEHIPTGQENKNNPNNPFKAVRYDLIIPLLIEATKELNEKIDKLEKINITK